MSFSFRNLFSEEASGKGGGARQIVADGGVQEDQGGGAFPPSEASFLASELLPFVPPAISANSGIPMDKEVNLPLPPDGSRDVKLSTIYQICPELFAAEITPLNDSVVTLPPRIGAGGYGAEQPFGNGSIPSPFSQTPPSQDFPGHHANQVQQVSNGAPDNPFWSSEGEGKSHGNGSSSHQEPEAQPAGGAYGAHPQDKNPTGVPDPSHHNAPTSPVRPQEIPVSSIPTRTENCGPDFGNEPELQNPFSFEPAKAAPAAESPHSDETDAWVAENGAGIPEPVAEIPQMEEAPVENEEPEAEGGYATLFSQKAEEDSGIPSPEASDQPFSGKPQAPEGPGASEPSGTAESERSSEPFQQSPQERAVPPSSQTQAQLVQPSEDGNLENADAMHSSPSFESVTRDVAAEENVEAVESASERSFFEELTEPAGGESQSAPPQKAKPQPATSPLVPLAGSRPADAPKAEATIVAEAKPEPAQQQPQRQPQPEQQPQPQRVEPIQRSVEIPNQHEEVKTFSEVQKTETPSNPVISPRPASDQFRHLELKAIFGTSEDFSVQKVANLVCSLSGIASCAVFTRSKVARASRDGMPQHEEGGPEIARSVRELARMNGIEDASSFTLQTDTGMISLFLEGASCLSVRHESGQFEPGVREKMILVARSLDQLDD